MMNLSSENYNQFIEDTIVLAQHPIQVFAKPGVASWRSPSPTDHLLSEFIHPQAGERIVFLGCGNGALAARIGMRNPDCTLWLSDLTCLSLECTKRTLAKNSVHNVTIFEKPSLLPEQRESFDMAILVPGKGRKLTRRWLVEVFHLLKRSGKLYLAGSNDLGIQSIIADAAVLFGLTPKILGYKKGQRAVLLEKQSTSIAVQWGEEPGIKPETWHIFTTSFFGRTFTIYSLPGVFSYDRLDEGTTLLLDSLPAISGGRILDVGCGYGIIGLFVAARLSELPGIDTRIDMVDANFLAIASAQKTLMENQHLIEPVVYKAMRVLPGDLMGELDDRSYDLILSNPPFHSGKTVNYTIAQALIQQSRRVLTQKGRLILVANRFIRYEKLMGDNFKQVDILNQTNRYHVISASYPI